jgi:hypothetical protein
MLPARRPQYLLPVMDMVNNADPEAVNAQWKWDEDNVYMQATRDLKAGEQVRRGGGHRCTLGEAGVREAGMRKARRLSRGGGIKARSPPGLARWSNLGMASLTSTYEQCKHTNTR